MKTHTPPNQRLLAAVATMGTILFFSVCALAQITGICSNCHTMHNSQDGLVMANYGGETGPNDFLTRGSCLGCHAQGGPNRVVTIGPDRIPQVFHTDALDLAGGNFAYITGAKGGGASDAKGHNIIGLTNQDAMLYAPPGGIKQSFHDDGFIVNAANLGCAGTNGCHGYRLTSLGSGIAGLKGSHHQNVDGRCDTAVDPWDSYRFVIGLKGLEDPNWENSSPTAHNEYFGRTTPIQLGCSGGSEVSCHGSNSVRPPDGTISQFCATCHGNFHTLQTARSDGVGTVAVSPFIRHPTDLALKTSGEYAAYTTYSVEAPVARTGAVPTTPSATVTPGSDAVMCLSCHAAHATDYPDMLRWDYTKMVAHNAGTAAGTGCFVCHTTKDD